MASSANANFLSVPERLVEQLSRGGGGSSVVSPDSAAHVSIKV